MRLMEDALMFEQLQNGSIGMGNLAGAQVRARKLGQMILMGIFILAMIRILQVD